MAALLEGVLERKESPEWLSWETLAVPGTPGSFEFSKTLNPGQGAEIAADQFTLLRITHYEYSANAANFAGRGKSNEIRTLRADQLPSAVGLRKGGSRLVVVTWQAEASEVVHIELLDVSSQPEALEAVAERMKKNGYRTDEEINSAPKWFQVLARACAKGCVARDVSGADRNAVNEASSFQQFSKDKPIDTDSQAAIKAAQKPLAAQVLTCGSSAFVYDRATLATDIARRAFHEKYYDIFQVKNYFFTAAEPSPVTSADLANDITAKRDVYLLGSPYSRIQPDPEKPSFSRFYDNSGNFLKLSMILRDRTWRFDIPVREANDFTCDQDSFLSKSQAGSSHYTNRQDYAGRERVTARHYRPAIPTFDVAVNRHSRTSRTP